ncbi:MAG: gamma-glutamyl-gamma-aminobutyrate hydrolase family protein [Rhizobiales bacterium]|nr:gamma-glutamyl-gamma-aminobutyrate hydrolase family protein [Hyphomicrobiales bacterium]
MTNEDLVQMPLVGLPGDTDARGGFTYHRSDGKYLRAVLEVSGALPVIVPALAGLDPRAMIAHLDGVVVTGAVSNVHPAHYGAELTTEAEPHDPARDAGAFGLIHAALEADLPLFAICRGIQELNVALGGTLHTAVHEIEGRIDHRDPGDEDMDVRYGPRHKVVLEPGGLLAAITGKAELMVNSLHRQAIDRLAPGLVVEARAEDGTIEAVRVETATSFTLAVQWHPEYDAARNPDSHALFRAFADAVRKRVEKRCAA